MRKFQYQELSRQPTQNLLKADLLQQVTYSALIHCYFELFTEYSVLGNRSFFSELAFLANVSTFTSYCLPLIS